MTNAHTHPGSLPSQQHKGDGRGWINNGTDRKKKALTQVRLKTKTIEKIYGA
ncbi:hypothetical protein HMPREF1989_02051 [Porphyromonas gingivalis F0566]|uniref:Uncharacterized protein n=1 Tax=Porphyromonas gingivalis (strain ATCC 33277 / DSM 20709 / CIP 103683 / JCM 12257 / NCTC 11834 / 2561) TaxID=431947 RepID=B2RKH9_PORG3|nr:hypothetical protein HMPREF1989_02051 [Porphyromonas gingivalis F0566]BAG33874.1 conserved hypothetical protein [Porphyromonas gingivalis ATCC 33277]